MTGFARHVLPADITAFAGDFASQPLAFAHLLDVAPAIDLDHVEVIPATAPIARLTPYFGADTAQVIRAAATGRNTLLLILPAAYPGLDCPFGATDLLSLIGTFRGTITRMIPAGGET
ncbi:hypothetical protein [Rhodophyticola porphyridii]|uniref:Uncharacterized protein n=1 Tax=Rhodophyticola porphyridii TaxID=1852017 RepID=A0A3L9YA59_9RHOB|nr:hypothetical protein [Rhodophyticola porphyridii]RMA44007.1 hypothetical protein D9R08_03605 [Rhodophyticola porphyridii]